MFKRVKAIRGATSSLNNCDDIRKNVCELCNKIFIENKLKQKDIISIFFSVTKDITLLNPATALRTGNLIFDSSKIALFCCQESEIQNALPNLIRVMITTYSNHKIKNIYINGAEKLRPDLSLKN